MTEILRYAAFTQDPAGGNPAGVVLDADGMTDEDMQTIAGEVGYSETAFAARVPKGGRHWNLRFFSPRAEVAFCGHATIATAVVLAEREGTGAIVFKTLAGEISVETEFQSAGVRATLRSVATHSRPATQREVNLALSALHWSADELAQAYPPHVGFAGNDHLILAAGTRERLADLAYDFEALLAVMTRHGWTTIQLFWEENEFTIHSRNPFPVGGVVEDPATGAAAAALGGYFRELGLVRSARSLTVRQGEDMGRPSELGLSVLPDDARVTVAGYAVPVPS